MEKSAHQACIDDLRTLLNEGCHLWDHMAYVPLLSGARRRTRLSLSPFIFPLLDFRTPSELEVERIRNRNMLEASNST